MRFIVAPYSVPSLKCAWELAERPGQPRRSRRSSVNALLTTAVTYILFEKYLLVLLPRGNGKTCLQALVALHHLLTVDDAEWPSSGEGPPSSQRQEGSRNMYRSLARGTAD